ncbi:MAG: hypothetical protein QOK38_1427, partial [Acidobacteriaceae bacterium]|nr:hypothetical protein [Acidobacteriaceae bacterium]
MRDRPSAEPWKNHNLKVRCLGIDPDSILLLQKEKGPEAAPQGLREMLTKTLSALHFLQTGSLATQA